MYDNKNQSDGIGKKIKYQPPHVIFHCLSNSLFKNTEIDLQINEIKELLLVTFSKIKLYNKAPSLSKKIFFVFLMV